MSTQALTSWISYAADHSFPLENIPYGIFKTEGSTARAATRIGDHVIDLAYLQEHQYLQVEGLPAKCFSQDALNEFMGAGHAVWVAVRKTLQALFAVDGKLASLSDSDKKAFLHPADQVQMLLPARIGDYTDFYASKEHASNLGKILRPNDAALQPNWTWIPIGYHGRASSVIVSGTVLKRPHGQLKPPTAQTPSLGATKKLDYELELGFFVGTGNELGNPIHIDKAEGKLFGVVLLNDWSARDIQGWEYVPLGPFGGKNFATTISPWIITMEALEPFRVQQPVQEPEPLDYLKDTCKSGYDINLKVTMTTQKDKTPFVLSDGNFKYMYWTAKQQLVHHSVTGCNMNPGDLLGTGTISGPEPTMLGSLMEISWNGTKTLELPSGEKRTFLEDGDTLNMEGYCQGQGYRVGFGSCSGTVLPAQY